MKVRYFITTLIVVGLLSLITIPNTAEAASSTSYSYEKAQAAYEACQYILGSSYSYDDLMNCVAMYAPEIVPEPESTPAPIASPAPRTKSRNEPRSTVF